MIVQWGVTLGVWYCLLVDSLGNWAGQQDCDHPENWLYIIGGCIVVLLGTHLAAMRAWIRR